MGEVEGRGIQDIAGGGTGTFAPIPVAYPMDAVRRFGGLAELDGDRIVTITNHELLAYLTYGPSGLLLVPTGRGWMFLSGGPPPGATEHLALRRPFPLRREGASLLSPLEVSGRAVWRDRHLCQPAGDPGVDRRAGVLFRGGSLQRERGVAAEPDRSRALGAGAAPREPPPGKPRPA